MERFDTTRPNVARVWDYWLGGKDNFAADRELAEKMLAVHPVTAQMARENRQFLGRAVSHVAACGVRQMTADAAVGSSASRSRSASTSQAARWHSSWKRASGNEAVPPSTRSARANSVTSGGHR